MTQGGASEDEANRGDPALIGRVVAGKYKIEKFLGGGAMGAVYRARQSSLEKNVAVKVMHRAVAMDPNYVGRFHREAKAASRLDHPNSMRVIDFGEEPDGLLYIAMEYVEGRDLYRVIHDDWPISNADLADILMQALAAIAVAHEMGVIHRDLKPENLMILRAKNDEEKDAYLVKVCDFGIAKITESDDDAAANTGKPGHKLTTQGLVVGTPEYMSPEQARGEKLDARSDIYSMGIILYQLLTGRTPFTADTALAVVLKHITEPPAAPSVHYAGVHKGLEAVCLRALAKDRAERFQTARAMRTAIREALDARPQPVIDAAATTAVELNVPSGMMAVAGTVPIVVSSGGTGDARARSGPVAAVESAPTVAGGMTASHLTPLGTASVLPEPRKSRVGVVVMVAALVAVGAAAALAAPRLLAKKDRDRVTSEPTGSPPAPTAPTPVPSGTIMPVKTNAVPTAEPAPSDSKGPKHGHPVPSARNTGNPTSTVKAAAVEADPPPPPPVVTSQPEPASVAPPVTPPPVTPPAGPAFNPQSCRASTGTVKTNGAASPRDLTMNGTAAAWTSCAQRAFKERPGGPISAVVHVSFNDSRAFKGAQCPSCPPPLAACITSSTQPTVSVNFRGGDVTGDPVFSVPITVVCE